jgi:hypothetical protein
MQVLKYAEQLARVLHVEAAPLSRTKTAVSPETAIRPTSIDASSRLRVYFTAFESRFTNTCCISPGSPSARPSCLASPTRSSAAGSGVRPTVYPELPLAGKPSDIERPRLRGSAAQTSQCDTEAKSPWEESSPSISVRAASASP